MALDETQVPELVTQLNTILGHMEVLSKVDTAGVDAATGVSGGGLPLREDEGPQIPLARAPSTFAPRMQDGLFLVPRLATHEDTDGADE
jgi:aspartyl-tRNA(Asn)/glutamyl-tRNA(Gln) amidotransferase subunit C